MPISRSNRTYYTKEEYEAAKRNDNALLYAQRQGYDLVRTGRYFYLRQHDSLVFAPSGAWFWNSRGLSGRALEFIVFFEGRSFPEAVLILAGTVQPGFTPRVIPRSIPPPVKQPQPIPFALPKPADNNRQLFAYLCGRRKLEEAIVREMLEQKVLYESVSPNHIHNACFVSKDETGKPCSAFLRGMGEKPFKGEVPGGSKNHGWLLHGKQSDILLVFEAAIDAASYVMESAARRQLSSIPYKTGNDALIGLAKGTYYVSTAAGVGSALLRSNPAASLDRASRTVTSAQLAAHSNDAIRRCRELKSQIQVTQQALSQLSGKPPDKRTAAKQAQLRADLSAMRQEKLRLDRQIPRNQQVNRFRHERTLDREMMQALRPEGKKVPSSPKRVNQLSQQRR